MCDYRYQLNGSCDFRIPINASNGHISVLVLSVSRQRNRIKPKPNCLFKTKTKPNQTVYELSVFKPNQLTKS
mgnify:CR=1 FL=1